MRLLFLLIFFAAAAALSAQTELTIYNDNFGVVKERRVLALKQGENEVRITDVAAWIEPDSVIVRDVADPDALRVLEQNYEADPLDQGLLLKRSEGQVIEFESRNRQTGETTTVQGRVLRSGYEPDVSAALRFGRHFQRQQQLMSRYRASTQPIVEVDGRVQFGLPGAPRFGGLDEAAFLKPTLLWKLDVAGEGEHEVELSYLTGGMRWEVTYNAVATTDEDRFDVTAWVTLDNASGKDFEQAQVKLMAGDVARIAPAATLESVGYGDKDALLSVPSLPSERPFDDFHLYSLPRPVTLLNGEMKQVELMRVMNIPAKRIYIYEGFRLDRQARNLLSSDLRNRIQYGTRMNSKVWTMLEFENSTAAGLGVPLPSGKVKFYRRDGDGRNEFVGEDAIGHTPADETLRLYTGNAFDLVGQRKQTAFEHNSRERLTDEDFEIRIRNHKDVEVEVRIVERLYRWANWDIQSNSHDFTESDSRTIEFRPRIPPGDEAVVTYRAHYSW